MEGTISSFRRGRRTQTMNQMIVHPQGSETKESAEKLVGKKATFTTPAGKKIVGKVSAAHGGNGAVRVLFETGMPGQAVTQKVLIE